MAKYSLANDRYFTLTDDGIPKKRARETCGTGDPIRETKIACSPEIEATISFSG